MKPINAWLLSCLLGAGLGGCGGGGDDSPGLLPIGPPPGAIHPGDALVYEGRQSLQCGTRGLTTQESAQKLVNGGIDVVLSNCGVITGVVYAAVCGAGTGEILIHEIRAVNLPDAEKRGFKSVVTLTDPIAGTDWAKVDCQTGAMIPD